MPYTSLTDEEIAHLFRGFDQLVLGEDRELVIIIPGGEISDAESLGPILTSVERNITYGVVNNTAERLELPIEHRSTIEVVASNQPIDLELPALCQVGLLLA